MEHRYLFEDARKIGKVRRYSYCMTLPKEIIQALGWRTRQPVVVSGRSRRCRPGRKRIDGNWYIYYHVST